MQWVGRPMPTDEQVEQEIVSLIRMVMDYKRRNDRPGARWRVGTKRYLEQSLGTLDGPQTAVSGSYLGSAHRAAQEIADYHGMELQGNISEDDDTIYAYTDRFPTIDERKQRAKDPLTVKQKLAFRKMKAFMQENNRAPTKSELMNLLGHRSSTSTHGLLDILERKNWVFVSESQPYVELI